MNNSNIPTSEKIMIPLRLPPDIYKAMLQRVRNEKDNNNRGYSVNQYLTELIENNLYEERGSGNV